MLNEHLTLPTVFTLDISTYRQKIQRNNIHRHHQIVKISTFFKIIILTKTLNDYLQ